MKIRLVRLCLAFFCLLASAAAAERAAQRPNVLFIAIDDLNNDLGSFGATHARTPHLDAFARTSRPFTRHYVHVPTCGASRAALLRGQRPSRPVHLTNNAIRDTQTEWAAQSLPGWFRQHGYRTFALGKITHYPGGLTGTGWAEGPEELPGVWDRAWLPQSPWKTAKDVMHGYANGQPRVSGQSPAWEAQDGPDSAYPDAWVADESIATLRELAGGDRGPWMLAVGFFKPHLPFAAPKRWFDLHDPSKLPAPVDTARAPAPSSWHQSNELLGNYGQHPSDPSVDEAYARQLRHGYAAVVSYVDAQVGRLLEAVEALGLARNTVIVVWSDHGFSLGEQGIWAKHALYEAALRSPLMIRTPELTAPGAQSRAVVESVDIFPTLTDLCGLPTPDGLSGQSLRSYLQNPTAASAKPALAWFTRGQSTIRTDDWRLIVHRPDAATQGMELFDFRSAPEGRRVDPQTEPAVVAQLRAQLPTPAALQPTR